jgi:hypothetical protein
MAGTGLTPAPTGSPLTMRRPAACSLQRLTRTPRTIRWRPDQDRWRTRTLVLGSADLRLLPYRRPSAPQPSSGARLTIRQTSRAAEWRPAYGGARIRRRLRPGSGGSWSCSNGAAEQKKPRLNGEPGPRPVRSYRRGRRTGIRRRARDGADAAWRRGRRSRRA